MSLYFEGNKSLAKKARLLGFNVNYVCYKLTNTPAIAALIKLAIVAASIAFMPKRAMSGRRLGAIEPIPPSKIAMEDRLAKPHKAKVTIA